MGGFHDAVLVVGTEQRKAMSSSTAPMSSARRPIIIEKPNTAILCSEINSDIAQIYIEKYGASEELWWVAFKNTRTRV